MDQHQVSEWDRMVAMELAIWKDPWAFLKVYSEILFLTDEVVVKLYVAADRHAPQALDTVVL